MFESVSAAVIILGLIGLLLLLILITLGTAAVYSGLFFTPEIGAGKPPIGKVVLAYKFCKGPYNESGQVFTEAVIVAPKKKTLGVYYDDPHKVDSSRCRYIVGSIISQDSEPVDEELVKTFSERGFKLKTLPEVDHVVKSTFPYLSTLSIIFGAYKVYPRLNNYIQEKNLCAYPFLEYYEDEMIHYFAPLSKQDDFFAPECEDDDCEHVPSPLDETLNSTQSTVADSVNDTLLESNDPTDSPAKEEITHETVIENLKSLKPTVNEDGAGDEGNHNSDADLEDNSSSSSFEVLKDVETTEL